MTTLTDHKAHWARLMHALREGDKDESERCAYAFATLHALKDDSRGELRNAAVRELNQMRIFVGMNDWRNASLCVTALVALARVGNAGIERPQKPQEGLT